MRQIKKYKGIIIDKFIRARHWQLFLWISVPTLFISSIIVGRALNRLMEVPATDVYYLFDNYLRYIPLLLGITLSVFLLWLWAVGSRLQMSLPQNLRMRMRTFRFLIFFPLCNAVVFAIVAICLAYDFKLNTYIFAMLVPLNLVSSAGVFYGTYFVAKTIRTVELQRMAYLKDFIRTSLLIWLYFAGIWYIQPKVHRLLGIDTASTGKGHFAPQPAKAGID